MNPFLRAQKKTLVCFSRFSLFAFRFSLFARAQASKQMHMYTLRERERERELKTKNENRKKRKKRDKFSQTSERLRERTLPRCRDLSLDKVVRRRLKSILKSIDKIDKIENSVLPQCFSRSLLLPPSSPSSPSSPLAPASPVADSDGHLPAEMN